MTIDTRQRIKKELPEKLHSDKVSKDIRLRKMFEGYIKYLQKK